MNPLYSSQEIGTNIFHSIGTFYLTSIDEVFPNAIYGLMLIATAEESELKAKGSSIPTSVKIAK